MIINEYTVTKDLYMKWSKDDRKSGLSLKITILWGVIVLILTVATIIYMASAKGSSHASDVKWVIVLEAAMIAFCVYQLFFRWKNAASAMYDKIGVQIGYNWTRTMDFRQDALYIREGEFEVNYPYSEIVSVRSKGNEILLETDKKLILHAYKERFVQGDYARFKRFIESKVVNRCFLN